VRELLQEIIDAGQGAEIPLDMGIFHCGTACCLCGDVAVARYPDCDDDADWRIEANLFSDELDDASRDACGGYDIADSICRSVASYRRESARLSCIFTEEELKHPHLTTDHHDRAIAHDWIRVVMSKLPEGDK
jgi:hypothetical protein